METILVVTGILLRGGSSGGDIFVSGRDGLAIHCSPVSPQMRPVGMNLSPNGLALQATRDALDAQRCAPFPVDGLVGFRESWVQEF